MADYTTAAWYNCDMSNPNAKDNLVPFKKGADPRRNIHGRPIRTAKRLSREWQNIWAEVLYDDKGAPILDDATGKELTRLLARMRLATSSRNPQEFRLALEYAYGKVRDELDITSAGKPIQTEIVMRWVDDDTARPTTTTDTDKGNA